MKHPITLVEWIEYLKEPWPEGRYADDTLIRVQGVPDAIPADFDLDPFYYEALLKVVGSAAEVKIESGVILDKGDDELWMNLRAHFKTWRTINSVERIVVTVEKERAAAVRGLLQNFGVKFT